MPAATRSCPACHTPLPEEAHFCLNCGAATPTDPDAPARTAATGAVEVDRVRAALANRYRIERVIGEGGMATVYLAEDLKHHRQVALKVMRSELAATVGAERFLREIEIAARLSHPHILPVHDSGEATGFLFYVMPYVEGESLRERLLRQSQLPADEAVRLAREVAEALGYAHKRGIIHRDIKPGNILLSEGHALVMDFGIARAVEGGEALTQTGLAVGTPQYMSPEQALGSREVDARTDVYAVGGVLYEMLAGEPPFAGPTPQAVLTRSLTEDPRPLRATRAGLPESVERVVQQAMSTSPADRYQTGGELAEALGGALDMVRSGATTPTVAVAGPAPTRVAAFFGLSAAGVLAVVYAVLRQLGLPPWMFALAVGLMVAGLPIMVLTGREERRRLAGAAGGGIKRLLTWRNAIGGGVLAIAFWAVVATAMVVRRPEAAVGGEAVRLAVLPFENRGGSDDDYFVEGIADEIRGKLLNVPGFAVIARSSSAQYRGSSTPLPDIGQELGADYLLTATVRWAKGTGGADRVQVVPELVDVRTGDVAWQQSFDAALTDVFQVQSDIAVRVAGALNVALGASEERDLAARPTENLAAYDAYLKGEEARQSGGQIALRQAVNSFEQAVALDSTFALAWARLSAVQSDIYFQTPTPEAAAAARSAADRALALAPEAPESHLAMGSYLRDVLFDFGRAREQFEEGLRIAPNDVGLLIGSAMNERSLGRSESQLALLRRAQTLDPRSASAQGALATALIWLRRYPEALEATDRALALNTTSVSLLENKAMIYLAQGDLPGARAVLQSAPPEIEPTRLVAFVAATWDLFWLLDDEQQRLLLRLSPGAFDDERSGWALALAATHHLRGNVEQSRAYGDSARLALEALLLATPDDNYLLALNAVALVYAGRGEEAIRSGERSVELLPIAKDAFSGAYNQHELARVYAILGDAEKTLDQLEALLATPYFLSGAWLRIDPTFAFLKGHPRFERLVAGS
jgi:serine/threonine-protein kinase